MSGKRWRAVSLCISHFRIDDMTQVDGAYCRNRMLISVNKYKFVDKNKQTIYSLINTKILPLSNNCRRVAIVGILSSRCCASVLWKIYDR